MKIDKNLNLVITLDRGEDDKVHVYHTPILRATFERYYRVISKVMTDIYAENLTFFSGPAVCSLMLKDTAEHMLRADGSGLNWWEGPDGVKDGLVEEIRRLTNVLVLGSNGWEVIPYTTALKRDVFTEDEAAEVEGSIAFFTFSSRMKTNPVMNRGLLAAASMLEWELTSSSLMEYRTSLMTLIEDESIGESPTVVALSIPS
jgi:hypothetical protein